MNEGFFTHKHNKINNGVHHTKGLQIVCISSGTCILLILRFPAIIIVPDPFVVIIREPTSIPQCLIKMYKSDILDCLSPQRIRAIVLVSTLGLS